MKHLENQKFGKLTVLRDSGQRDRREILWECQCECGQIKLVRTSRLTSKEITSCGSKDCKYKPRIKDITNQYFNNFLVLEPTDKRRTRSVVWKCQCQKCNQILELSEMQLMNNFKCECSKDENFSSKGEKIIRDILLKNNINFEEQKTFETCRFLNTKAKARFDFYLPNDNLLIEYDGEQHFKYRSYGWNDFEHFKQTQYRDKFKNQWCKENNIPLIRIPYTQLNNLSINDLLLETSKFVVKE